MLIKIQYQCYNIDKSEAFTDAELRRFVEKWDAEFTEFLAEKGYGVFRVEYDPTTGIREILFNREVSA